VTFIKNITFNRLTSVGNSYVSESKSIDLLRLKNNYKIKRVGESASENIGGEIIDVVVEHYDNTSHFNSTTKINYSNNLLTFEFDVYDVYHIISDIEKILFINFFYPWLASKYEKRLSRYFLMLFIKSIRGISKDGRFYKAYFDDTKLDIRSILENNTMVAKHSLFYNVVLFTSKIKERIDNILKNTDEYLSHLSTYGYTSINIYDDTDVRNLETEKIIHHKLCLEKYNEFISNVVYNFEHFKDLFEIFTNVLNPEIERKISEEKINVVQWGGYKHLHDSYKKYYMNLKGGKIDFIDVPVRRGMGAVYEKMHQIDKPGGMSQPHVFTKDQYNYINLFMTNVLPSVSVNGKKFTSADGDGAVVMGCGSFGCGIKVTNSAANKKLVIKIIGDSTTSYLASLPEFMRETYKGYFITQNNLPNFNKIYAYFKTSNIPTDIYFSSVDDSITYDGIHDNTMSEVRKGNIFMLLMDAGENALENIVIDMKNFNATYTENIHIAEELMVVTKEMFKISKISTCSNISKKCIYVTHNDIKPANMIYKKILDPVDPASGKYYYRPEFVDYGGCLFSSSFFNEIGTRTPIFLEMVYGNALRDRTMTRLEITSPLYDIASTIYCMMLLIYDKNNGRGGFDIVPTLLDDLKVMYCQPVINFARITKRLVTLLKNMEDAITTNIFDSQITVTTTPSDMRYVRSLSYQLLNYVNLVLCINRFMWVRHDELKRAFMSKSLDKIDFKNFELLELKTTTVLLPKVENMLNIPSNLKNVELLTFITTEVERSVEKCRIVLP
jgi:hypothetical protein